MKQLFFVVFCLLISSLSFAQIRSLGNEVGTFGNGNSQQLDSLPDNEIDVKLSGKTVYTDYKIISFRNDTTFIDTTLTIKKNYQFNFRRKDNVELLPFHNQGQTFTNLAYSFERTSSFPDIGFRAKQFNYFRKEDVNYYQVPTPTTEIMYRTGLEQGQVLDVLFAVNFSKRFNTAIAYKGLRSLGKYRRSLASGGNLRFSFHYETPKGQYGIRGHYANQDITNQENGGLTPLSLQAFVTDDEDFSNNRGRLDVQLVGAENILDTERIYIEHDFKLLGTRDTINDRDFSNVKIGHAFTRQFKSYKFTQNTTTEAIFGLANKTSKINDSTFYKLTDNQVFLDFNSRYILGKFRVKSSYTTYSYGYDAPISYANATLDKLRLEGKAVSFGADWHGKLGNFHVNANANITPGDGRLGGQNFYGEAFYKKDSILTVKGKLSISSTVPNFNFLLHQSSYNTYNWQHDFKNIGIRNLGGTIQSKWGNASLNITNMSNYVYFDENSLPKQFNETINYLKLNIQKEFKVWKLRLDNTVLYQNVSRGSNVFRVPEFVTRNTFYYEDDWFKGNPLLVNIGVTFNYFTPYKMNAYNPLLSEFYLQNTQEIGYPTFDVFFNGRVRRTRVYFKIDNVTSRWMQKKYFSAPSYPYRDFVIRFGLVWNWFI